MTHTESPASPPLDLDVLRRSTLGNLALEREVLAMFRTQAGEITRALARRPQDPAALIHTLKGSARAVGACRVAEAAAELERAIRQGDETACAWAALDGAVSEASDTIRQILDTACPVAGGQT